MRALILLACLALGACASTPEPKIVTREVKMPVVTPCVPKGLGAEPSYPDTDAALKAAGGAADRYGLLAAGRALRQQRLAEVEPIIRACRSP